MHCYLREVMPRSSQAHSPQGDLGCGPAGHPTRNPAKTFDSMGERSHYLYNKAEKFSPKKIRIQVDSISFSLFYFVHCCFIFGLFIIRSCGLLWCSRYPPPRLGWGNNDRDTQNEDQKIAHVAGLGIVSSK